MDMNTASVMKCTSKDVKFGVDDMWSLLINKEFDIKCSKVYRICSAEGFWPAAMDTELKTNAIFIMGDNEKKITLYRNVMEKINKFKDYEHFCKVVALFDPMVRGDTCAFYQEIVKCFNKISNTDFDYKFRFLQYVVKRSIADIELYMRNNFDDATEYPALFAPGFGRALIGRCENLIEYARLSEDPDAFIKEYDGYIVRVREWMKHVATNYKCDKDMRRVFKGPKGGKYVLINGTKRYIR